MRLAVFIENWQMESGCGERPPSVGDRVEWSLLFLEADDPPGRAGRVTLSATATPYAREFPFLGVAPTRLDVNDTRLYWDAPREVVGDAVPVTGFVQADWHGYVPLDFPATAGTVTGIEIERRRHVARRPREFVPVGDPWYETVETSPKWFRRGGVVETGVLITLET